MAWRPVERRLDSTLDGAQLARPVHRRPAPTPTTAVRRALVELTSSSLVQVAGLALAEQDAGGHMMIARLRGRGFRRQSCALAIGAVASHRGQGQAWRLALIDEHDAPQAAGQRPGTCSLIILLCVLYCIVLYRRYATRPVPRAWPRARACRCWLGTGSSSSSSSGSGVFLAWHYIVCGTCRTQRPDGIQGTIS